MIAPLSGELRASADARSACATGRRAAWRSAASPTPAKVVGGRAEVQDRFAVSWYRPGSESWWAVAPAVAERGGRAKAGWIGTWTMWASLAAVLAPRAFAVAAVAGRARRPVHGRPWACALVALVNAAAWAVVTPPFQVPTSTSTCRTRTTSAQPGDRRPRPTLSRGNPADVIGRPRRHVVSARSCSTTACARHGRGPTTRRLSRAGAAPQSRGRCGGRHELPAALLRGRRRGREDRRLGNVLDRMTLMRLASALFAGDRRLLRRPLRARAAAVGALGVGGRGDGRGFSADARVHRAAASTTTACSSRPRPRCSIAVARALRRGPRASDSPPGRRRARGRRARQGDDGGARAARLPRAGLAAWRTPARAGMPWRALGDVRRRRRDAAARVLGSSTRWSGIVASTPSAAARSAPARAAGGAGDNARRAGRRLRATPRTPRPWSFREFAQLHRGSSTCRACPS